jgi:hypothetical protein
MTRPAPTTAPTSGPTPDPAGIDEPSADPANASAGDPTTSVQS